MTTYENAPPPPDWTPPVGKPLPDGCFSKQSDGTEKQEREPLRWDGDDG